MTCAPPQAFSLVLGSVAENVAAGLNVLLQHVSHFLQTAGIRGRSRPCVRPSMHASIHPSLICYLTYLVSTVGIPIREVTPEGLVFVTQWVLAGVIGYWTLSLVFHVVTNTLRQAMWLLKVGVALACFGYILSDRSADPETIAIQMGVLVLFCFLLGVGTSGGTNVTDKASQLEEQVRILESRLRDMERWRTDEGR